MKDHPRRTVDNQILFEKFVFWKNSTLEEKGAITTQAEFARVNNISEIALANWTKQMREPSDDDNVMKTLTDKAVAGTNAKFIELYLRAKGMLVDKSEVKLNIELSADQLAQLELDARRELKDERCAIMESQGEAKVQKVPRLLSENIRED